jgi:membrane protein
MADDTPDSKRSASDYAPPSNSDSGSADRDRRDPEDGDAGGRSRTRGGSAKPEDAPSAPAAAGTSEPGEGASSEERPPKESPETKRADRKSPFGIVKETFSAFSGDDCSTMAAAVAYYTVFSLPPLLIVVIFVAGLFLDPAKVQQVIQQQVGGLVGPEGAEQIGTMIQNAGNLGQKGLVGLVAGIAGLLFGATGAFAQLQTALNRAWNIEPAPEGGGIVLIIFKRILSLGMVLGIAFLLLVSLVLSAALSALSGVLAQFMPGGVSAVALYVLDVTVSLAVIALLFAAVFKVLPDAKIAWRDVWMGGFVTALLFVAGKFAIGFYLGRSNPGQAFGAAGSLALILVWVYYSAMIVFLGAEFTQSWAKNKGKGIEPGSDAVRMSDQPAGA